MNPDVEASVAVDPQTLSELLSSQLSSMKPADVAHVASVLERREIPASTRLLTRGERSDRAYIVVEGALEITLACQTTVLKLATREPGEWAGELGMIEPGEASANVEAAVDSVVWVLTHDDYVALLQARPVAAAAFTEMVCRDVARRLRQCDAVTFHREEDGGMLAIHPHEPKESLLGHLKRFFGGVRS